MPIDDLRYFKKLSGQTLLQTLEAGQWADVSTEDEKPIDPPPVEEWTFLANEKDLSGGVTFFSLSKNETIRYGVPGKWAVRTLTPGRYSRADFGADPAPGEAKRFEKKSNGGIIEPPIDPPIDPPPTGETQTKTYGKDSSNFLRPESGFTMPLVSYSDNIRDLDAGRLEGAKAQGISVINRRYAMVTFRNSAISGSYLDHIGRDMNLCRQYGMKMVIRFCFTFNENGGSYADASIEHIERCLAQLESLLERNADIIAYAEAGFIGRWGEWNKSANGLGDESNPQNTAAQSRLVKGLLQILPKNRMITLRYLGRKKAILSNNPLSSEQAWTETDQARTGHMNDYFTIDDWGGSDRAYLEQDTLYTVQGGEPIKLNGRRSECTAVLDELTRYHWSTMNIPGSDFSDLWRRGGCYDSIQKRLGARYFMTKAVFPTKLEPNKPFALSIDMTNEGFAGIYNPRDILVCLKDPSGKTVKVQTSESSNKDARRILPLPGRSKTLELRGVAPDLAAGNYQLSLHLPDAYESIANRAEYSLRFANTDVWQSATGFNRLGSVSV